MENFNDLVVMNNGIQAVSGRRLHEKLGVETDYRHWFSRMVEYGFAEDVDYVTNLSDRRDGAVGKPFTDHILTIDMAKHLAMMTRNENGMKLRNYFIEVEKEWNSPEKLMARALDVAHKSLAQCNVKIKELETTVAEKDQLLMEAKPKVTYYDQVLQSATSMPITLIATDYGMSAQCMNKKLAELGIQYKMGETWILVSKYSSFGYTKSKTVPYTDNAGVTRTKLQTNWTQKGRLFLYAELKKVGVLPLIEREDVA